MADVEDKEKAEKLAAAKKRFEQLKKQKGKKGGSKKKDEKAEATTAKDGAEKATAEATEEVNEDSAEAAPLAAESPETPEQTPADKEEDDTIADAPPDSEERPGQTRKHSATLESRQRSESFRHGSEDIYRKQHSRIEELEKENKSLKEAQSEHESRLQSTEAELEQLRESSGDVAELMSKAASADEKAKDVERLNAEITSFQRQLTQAQSANEKSRRKSNASPSREISELLAQKTSTIESLELELSNLRNQYHISQSANEASQITISELEQRAKNVEAAAETAKQETETLRETLAKSAEESKEKNEDEDPAALQQRITLLESDVRTAQTDAKESAQRAIILEQKIEALTKLHKDVTTTNTAREKEMTDLKSRLSEIQTKKTKSPKSDDAEESLSDLEDEEREKLHVRIRELEADNFELRRGVWREKRQALQPGLGEEESGATSPGYEDIDLNGSNPYSSSTAATRAGINRHGSTFQDVLQSGISAFTGRDRRPTIEHSAAGDSRAPGRNRGQSLGLLSEDGFDEDAFAKAQEEEGKKRIERIREVKRGLEDWRGWRVDLVDMRQGGLGGNSWTGPVFEV